jgi:hypothetical protein
MSPLPAFDKRLLIILPDSSTLKASMVLDDFLPVSANSTAHAQAQTPSASPHKL